MARFFGVTEQMDIDTLSQVVELREKEGLHVDYQYGLNIGGRDLAFPFPSPKYNGCSIRVFIYNKVTSRAKVRMGLETSPNAYFASIEVVNNTVQVKYGDGSEKNGPNNPGPISTNTFFSLGLRIDGNSLVVLFNRWVDTGFDMGRPVSANNWNTKIFTGLNYVVSLHICNEVGGNFPAKGLSEYYTFDALVLPIGSYVTVFAVFMGTASDTIWIGFRQDKDKPHGQQYYKVPMQKGEEFRITARNAIQGWLLTTSFGGRNQNAAVISRKNREERTDVQVSTNCYIRRVLAVCAAVPERYRPR